MVEGNAKVDILAKEGAEQHEFDPAHFDLFVHRKQLTKCVQNMLVTIWLKEKLRTFGDPNIRKSHDDEIQEILNMENAAEQYLDNDEEWETPPGF